MKFLYKLLSITLLILIGFLSGFFAYINGKNITAYTEVFITIIVVSIMAWVGLSLILKKND